MVVVGPDPGFKGGIDLLEKVKRSGKRMKYNERKMASWLCSWSD